MICSKWDYTFMSKVLHRAVLNVRKKSKPLKSKCCYIEIHILRQPESPFLYCYSLTTIHPIKRSLTSETWHSAGICAITLKYMYSNDLKSSSGISISALYHNKVMLLVRIFLTLSPHPSLLSITSGWFSKLYPVFAHNCCR